MDLEISGDKKIEVEDNETEPDGQDTGGALEEGNVVRALQERDAVEVPEEECHQSP